MPEVLTFLPASSAAFCALVNLEVTDLSESSFFCADFLLALAELEFFSASL